MPGGKQYRTAVTRLEPTASDRELLERTIDEWRRACQIATDLAWNQCYEPGDVQALAYDSIREQTIIGSQHAILATRQAAEAIQGCVDRFARGEPASKPTFTAPTVRYDARSMSLFENETVSLATVGDRVHCKLSLPDEEDGYQWQFLDDDAWSVTESTLTVREGEYYLHLGFERSMPGLKSTAEGGTVLGVDLGLENLAVTSTARVFSGRELAHERRQLAQRRARLQQTGTRSARQTLDQIALNEQRSVRDRLHCISKAVVEEAVDHDCDVIAVENLNGIRSRVDHTEWFHVWAFRKLSNLIEYKARARGMCVERVDPAWPSQRCSKCGHTASENRSSRDQFVCSRCGYQVNADYNAAKNVGLRCVRRDQQSSRRTGTSRCALKSGTVTPNGSYTPYPPTGGVEGESADKSTS